MNRADRYSRSTEGPRVVFDYDPQQRTQSPQRYEAIEKLLTDSGVQRIDGKDLQLPSRVIDWPSYIAEGVIIEASSSVDTPIETADRWVGIIHKAGSEGTPITVIRRSVGALAVETALFRGLGTEPLLYDDFRSEAVPVLTTFLHQEVRNTYLFREMDKRMRQAAAEVPLKPSFIPGCDCMFHRPLGHCNCANV